MVSCRFFIIVPPTSGSGMVVNYDCFSVISSFPKNSSNNFCGLLQNVTYIYIHTEPGADRIRKIYLYILYTFLEYIYIYRYSCRYILIIIILIMIILYIYITIIIYIYIYHDISIYSYICTQTIQAAPDPSLGH